MFKSDKFLGQNKQNIYYKPKSLTWFIELLYKSLSS